MFMFKDVMAVDIMCTFVKCLLHWISWIIVQLGKKIEIIDLARFSLWHIYNTEGTFFL